MIHIFGAFSVRKFVVRNIIYFNFHSWITSFWSLISIKLKKVHTLSVKRTWIISRELDTVRRSLSITGDFRRSTMKLNRVCSMSVEHCEVMLRSMYTGNDVLLASKGLMLYRNDHWNEYLCAKLSFWKDYSHIWYTQLAISLWTAPQTPWLCCRITIWTLNDANA